MQSGDETAARLAAALAGDRAAWEEIVRSYNDLLWWVARTWRLDDAECADLVQTVWLQLVRHGASITNPARLDSWLSTTARREAARRVRNNQRTLPSDDVGTHAVDLAPQPDETVIDTETAGEAIAAFHKLNDQCRRLLGLLIEDPRKSYNEISAIFGKSVGWIGPTRQRCLATLRAEMATGGFA